MLGFVPVIRPLVAFASSVHVRTYRRLVARFCIHELFKSTIASRNGLFIEHYNSEGRRIQLFVYLRVPFNIADEPEMQASFVGSKIGAMSMMPCSVCEVVPRVDGLMCEGKHRDADVMKALFPLNGVGKVIDQVTANALRDDFSLHAEWNPAWSIPGYNPFRNPG